MNTNSFLLIQKTLNNILVPLDGSKNSIRGLKFAIGIAAQSKSSIIGLHVNSVPVFTEILPNIREKMGKKSKDIIKKAESIAKKNNVSFKGIIKESNNAGKTIITFAEKHNVELIIMGSRGPDPEIEMFFGSVAHHVINKSKIPVTIVK